jgi:hypothetical protein
MSPGTRLKKECEARLRDLVAEDEPILAVGTAEELRSLGSDIGSGGGWTVRRAHLGPLAPCELGLTR